MKAYFQTNHHTTKKRDALVFSLIMYFIFVSSWTLRAESDNTYPTKDRLFYISRSANKNLVCYDVNLKDDKLDTQKPLNVYWVNREERPGETNGLNLIQRKMAYGYKVVAQGNDRSEVTLTAYPDRKLTIQKHGSQYVCLTTINNQPVILQSLYVKAKEGNPLSVEYVEIHGINQETQEQVSERIKK